MKQILFIITGPTGVGKTDSALDLAQRMPFEIINADSGQFYAPLTIGTAKPDWKSSVVPHHGFDILTEPEQYTVVAYRSYVHELCKSIWSRNKIPLLVGGSLFYIKSLFFPPRAVCDAVPSLSSAQGTWDTLYAIDPVRAQAIHPHDTYRIQRALTLWYMTAQQPSTLPLLYQPLCDARLIFLTRQKDELTRRIYSRVITMFRHGFIDEVTALQNTPWEPFLQLKKFIGYPDILSYLQHTSGTITEKQLIERITQKTCQYAKRQHTFWRMLSDRIIHAENIQQRVTTETIDLTSYRYDLYISHLLVQLSAYV